MRRSLASGDRDKAASPFHCFWFQVYTRFRIWGWGLGFRRSHSDNPGEAYGSGFRVLGFGLAVECGFGLSSKSWGVAKVAGLD